jgi:two-component system sensor histidine kinase VicK
MAQADESTDSDYPFLKGGGEMGKLIRLMDWSLKALGTPESWHIALKQTVSMMLKTNFPVLICWGPDCIQLYNDAFRPINGSTKHPQALGGSARETYAEIWDTIGPLFENVMAGNTVGFPDFIVQLDRNGYLEDCYFDFSYSPISDIEGNVLGVLVICMETTERVRAINRLSINQENIRNMVRQAPVAIGILNGKELIIETANELMLKIWNKSEKILGLPLVVALPELKDQSYLQLLKDVYTSGEAYYRNEAPALLEHNGELQEFYFNFIFQPLNDVENIDTIMVVAIDVTEHVDARKEMERAFEQARLSKEAAELGTFDMNLEKGTMEWDERCRTLFGISHSETVTYETEFVEGLHPDDRERVLKIINNVLIKSISNGDYDVEYRTVGLEDQKLRWVRAKGKAYFDKQDNPVRFIGSVLDITEQKLDEIRKNDFIGMVSHELKTPLTSLTAYVQMLLGKASDNEDEFISGALEKANIQVKKMSTMINGFLNISRLESGKMMIEKQSFELTRLIQEMIEEVKLIASTYVISLSVCDPLEVYADRDKIGSVISNLLSNAVKYSPKGKHIDLHCQKVGDRVKISITDEGMGIKPQDIDKLFDRYYRVESKHTTHISGFGIGLYLSAEIVHRHEGKIGVESTTGIGSTFWFTLPITNLSQQLSVDV